MNPNKPLKVLVEFCLKVYFPSRFDDKLNSKMREAAVNYFHMLKRINQFPHKHARDIALNTLMHNGLSAQPKNILLSMLAGNDETIRC